MKFFLPATQSEEEAEKLLESIAKHNHRELPERMIYSIVFGENDQMHTATVGQPVAEYFRTAGPVIAIFPGDPVLVCVEGRGVGSGAPIFVGSASVVSTEYFD